METAGDGERAWKAMQEFERLYYSGSGTTTENELEQTRRELTELIEKYQQRIHALREHLREAEEEAGAAGDGSSPGSRSDLHD